MVDSWQLLFDRSHLMFQWIAVCSRLQEKNATLIISQLIRNTAFVCVFKPLFFIELLYCSNVQNKATSQ